MKVYIYDERYPEKGRHFQTLREMRDYALELHMSGKDWGMYEGVVHTNSAEPWEVAEILYGSWGRVTWAKDIF